LRVLGSARRDLERGAELTDAEIEHHLIFIGLAGMYDPPRPEAKKSVEECHAGGIRVVMITGDHPKTALAIAREIGLATDTSEALTGIELQHINDEELARRIEQIAVFARVTATDKLRIVRAWRANGHVVAMTGDGVNDAPALKGANIGVAMGRTGTEVTKQASDMIIADDNFATIVAAVEEGRRIYLNIRKALHYLLATNAGELIFMLLCIIAGFPIPLLPIHLLWINLVTDSLPTLNLATGAAEEDLMRRPPRPASMRLADARFIRIISITGLATALASFATYAWAVPVTTEITARTYAFATLVFSQLFCALAFLDETKVFWHLKWRLNARSVGVVAGACILQALLFLSPFAGHFLRIAPLSWAELFWILPISLLPAIALEIAGKRG
jgi:Ca2+-transporting ATPase